jgi:ParB family transcriptional regulator, chromosome partitioning protein
VPTDKKRTSLGRGFDALIPKNFDDTLLLNSSDKIEKVAISKLTANRYQPRQVFDDETLKQLSDSIKRYGVLQPLVVTATSNDSYMIIAGERRWRASQLAGMDTVPVIVRSAKELEQLEIALIENVQRVDLSPLEQAESIDYLHKQFGASYDEISEQLGKAVTTIHNIVRLLQLPGRAKDALRDKTITEGHARAILALKDYADKQEVLLNNIRALGWSVRQAEQFVTTIKQGVKEEKAARQRMQSETPATKALSKRLKVPVYIRRTARGGKIEVVFKSDDELVKIMKLLG